MSKDMRSVSQITTRKGATPKPAGPQESPMLRRKVSRVSTDEEDMPGTSQGILKPVKLGKRSRVFEVDDDESSAGTPTKKIKNNKSLTKLNEWSNQKKLKNASMICGQKPKRVGRRKPLKGVDEIDDIIMMCDNQLEQSVCDLDETALITTERVPSEEYQKPCCSYHVKQSPKEKRESSPKNEEIPSTSNQSIGNTPKEKHAEDNRKSKGGLFEFVRSFWPPW